MVDLTVLILNYNTQKLLKDCLQSIFSKKWQYNIKVVVVDNASSDESLEMIKKYFPQVTIIISKSNLGFTGGNNLGLKQLESKYCLLLNSDTKVLDGSLDNLIEFMERTDYGISSCKLLNEDQSLQANGGDLPLGWPLFFWIAGWDDLMPFIKKSLPSFHRQFDDFYRGERDIGWVSGAAMMIKKEVIEKIGYLDEAIFMYGEDVEYCLRAKKAGFKVGWTDCAQIVHLGGRSWVNPALNQWRGEFKGLLYIYQKYFGSLMSFFLRILIYTFIMLRAVAFLIIGKPKVSKTYAKIIFNI